MSKPTSADYKFFYHILQEYRKQYSGSLKIESLPEFYLDPRLSIDDEMNRILEHIDLTGEYVIVNIPVQTVVMDLRHSTVLEVLDTDIYFTFGRVVGREADGSYKVHYIDKRGQKLETIFMTKDILFWGKDAINNAPKTWNFQGENAE